MISNGSFPQSSINALSGLDRDKIKIAEPTQKRKQYKLQETIPEDALAHLGDSLHWKNTARKGGFRTRQFFKLFSQRPLREQTRGREVKKLNRRTPGKQKEKMGTMAFSNFLTFEEEPQALSISGLRKLKRVVLRPSRCSGAGRHSGMGAKTRSMLPLTKR